MPILMRLPFYEYVCVVGVDLQEIGSIGCGSSYANARCSCGYGSLITHSPPHLAFISLQRYALSPSPAEPTVSVPYNRLPTPYVHNPRRRPPFICPLLLLSLSQSWFRSHCHRQLSVSLSVLYPSLLHSLIGCCCCTLYTPVPVPVPAPVPPSRPLQCSSETQL